MTTIKQLEPHTEQTPGVTARLHFRRDFGSFQQQRPQPQRLPEATRAYQYGDPLRSIDWRAYARTDQLLVNQQHQTASADVLIAVSCHPSMQWPPADLHPDASAKLEIALRVALHLTFMHVKILDRVTLYLVATEVQQIKFTDATAVLDIYASMRNVDFSYPQITHCAAFTAAATPDLRQLRGDAKYWLGDGLHTAEQDFLNAAARCYFLHTLSTFELKSDWFNNDSSYFEQPREVLGKNLRRVFHPQLKQWLAATERRINQDNGKYLLLNENTPLAHYFDFLQTNLCYQQ